MMMAAAAAAAAAAVVRRSDWRHRPTTGLPVRTAPTAVGSAASTMTTAYLRTIHSTITVGLQSAYLQVDRHLAR